MYGSFFFFIGSDYTRLSTLRKCISKPWSPMDLLTVAAVTISRANATCEWVGILGSFFSLSFVPEFDVLKKKEEWADIRI